MSLVSLPLNPVIENKQFDVLSVKGKSLAEKKEKEVIERKRADELSVKIDAAF